MQQTETRSETERHWDILGMTTLIGKHQAELEELRPTAKMSQREWEEMLEVLSQKI